MNQRAQWAEKVYACAIQLYPPRFQDAHGEALRQAFRDALRDPSLSHRDLFALVLWDLAASLAKEHCAMMRDSFSRPLLVLNTIILSGIATGVALAFYAIPQHVLRSGLNDPQIQMANDIAVRLEQGVAPEQAIPTAQPIDMARSLAPFVIVYDDQGRPLAAQAELNGSVPVPPPGVFDYVRQHGEERLSWQPVLGAGGVRIATVIHRLSGTHPGFVLAGRNMREVETRIGEVKEMAGMTWLGMLTLIAIGMIAFSFLTRPKSNPPPAAPARNLS